MINKQLYILLLVLFSGYSIFGQNSSELVYLENGALQYIPFSMKGQSNEVNIIPDFSYAGYMGGGVALPTDISIEVTITPEEGDDAQRIQAAIDQVASLEPDNNGFRGVVLIKAGHYSLENLLTVSASGIVLRGEGQGLNGTVLHSNPRVEHAIINIFGASGTTKNNQTEQVITSDYVPVGSYSFDVIDASEFKVGDKIVVTRTPNQVWIEELGMDQETLCEGKSGCNGWTPSNYAINHERVITAISGNNITIDIPIVDVIQEKYGGGKILKIESTRRINQCGVENMRIQSFYEGNSDESHAWTAVRIKNAENCWVKQVTGQYLAYSTVNIESANFTTIQDCAYIDPKSVVSGGRRYAFAIQNGLGNLFQRCYAKNGRHDFVTGSRVTGPNVFLDGLAESTRSDIGPHHRWATGTLFDNIYGGSTRVWNRGSSGTGHGWSGAQTMFWNVVSRTGEFRVDSPLGSMNWGIGCSGKDQTGEGYWESWNAKVKPRSLYLQQLEDRMGINAVDNVIIPEQRSEDINELLNNWAGQGNFYDGGFSGAIPDVSFLSPTEIIEVSSWEGSDIEISASDSDGTIISVKLLINGEPFGIDYEPPYIFTDVRPVIHNLTHETHYLQVIATDNDANTNVARLAILGGDPPPPPMEEIPTQIRVFPNPIYNGELTIEMKEEGNYIVKIIDLQGRKVDYFKFEGIQYQLNCTNIVDGVYIIEIENLEEVVFKNKIIIL